MELRAVIENGHTIKYHEEINSVNVVPEFEVIAAIFAIVSVQFYFYQKANCCQSSTEKD